MLGDWFTLVSGLRIAYHFSNFTPLTIDKNRAKMTTKYSNLL